MTLCMAAICYDTETNAHRIVVGADRRAEVDWAGGNVALKYGTARKGWSALIAGDMSKAEEFLATCRTVFSKDDEPFTRDNIFDKFNEASCAHKEKLCRRYVRQQLGIDFDRFLDKGESELLPEVRGRIFHEMGSYSTDAT
jgi:hypothetical protein